MKKDEKDSGLNLLSKIEVICSFLMFLCRCTFLPFSFFIGFFSFLFLLKLIVGEEGAVSLLTSFAWPLAIVVVVLLFKSSIEHIVPRIKNLNILGLVLDLHSDATFRASQELGNNDSAKNIDDEPEGIEPGSEEAEIEEPETEEPETEEPETEEPKREESEIYEPNNSYINDELLKNKNLENQENVMKLSDKEKKESAKFKNYYINHLNNKNDIYSFERHGNKYFFERDFEEDDFDSSWREVVALINFLYLRVCGENKDLSALEKAKYLYKSDVINVAQYMTFNKLYEVMEFLNPEVTGSARERYLVSIKDLHKSLFKLYHSM